MPKMTNGGAGLKKWASNFQKLTGNIERAQYACIYLSRGKHHKHPNRVVHRGTFTGGRLKKTHGTTNHIGD